MTSSINDEAIITTHADHEVIVPPNRLRKAWTEQPPGETGDPVARAEQALASLSGEFSDWMDTECARLDAARRAIRKQGLSVRHRQALFHAAHDIKGEAETLGFPLAAAAAQSLCRLLDDAPAECRIPVILIDQHVDAVKAIVREHALPNAAFMATRLTGGLRAVTADFLLSVNGRSEDDMQSPPTVPGGAGK